MNKSNILLLFVCLFCLSCKPAKPRFDIINDVKKDRLYRIIDLSAGKAIDINISDFVSKIQYIKLVTNSECLIGSLDKIALNKGRIFIMDADKSHSLFCFDIKGDFLFRLDKGIGGPGEFTSIADFCVDEKTSEISILSPNQRLVLKYDRDGHFLNSSHIPFGIDNFKLLPNGNILLYRESKGFVNDRLSDSRLYVLGKNGKILKGWFVNSLNENISFIDADPLIAQDGAKYSVVRPYENVIYQFDAAKNDLTQKYYLDFGDNDLKKLASLKNFGELDEFRKNYSFYAGNALDAEGFLYFLYHHKGNFFQYLYNKKTEQETVIGKLENDIDGLPVAPFRTFYEGQLIGTVSATTMAELYGVAIKHGREKDPTLKSILKYGAVTDETDNPLVVLYKMK